MTITHDDIKAILGDLDEAKIIDILALKPALAELEEAAVWATGDGEVLGKDSPPLTGKVAAILEIIIADEEEEPPSVH